MPGAVGRGAGTKTGACAVGNRTEPGVVLTVLGAAVLTWLPAMGIPFCCAEGNPAALCGCS